MQFPHTVPYPDLRIGRHRQTVAAPLNLKPEAFCRFKCRLKMLGMPWDNNQKCISAIFPPCSQQFLRLVLPFVYARTAAHGNRTASDSFFKFIRQYIHTFRRHHVVFGITAHTAFPYAYPHQAGCIRLRLGQAAGQ